MHAQERLAPRLNLGRLALLGAATALTLILALGSVIMATLAALSVAAVSGRRSVSGHRRRPAPAGAGVIEGEYRIIGIRDSRMP